MNGTIFRFLWRWMGRRFKLGAGVFAFSLTGWIAAQHGNFNREPAAKLLAPQPIRGQELVARGLAPQYTSFPSLPPTGRVSPSIQPKTDASSNMSWVFGPSGPPPTYLFGRSSKTNPISTEQPRFQQHHQQQTSSYFGSTWSNVKNLVLGNSSPSSPSQPPTSRFGWPSQLVASSPPVSASRPTTDTGIYAREPAYRWYGWGTTTPGTNPYAPNGQYPQASATWYVQSGATPGAFPAPPQPVQLAEYSSEAPRYSGNPIFGPEITSGPTLWMNAPRTSVPVMPPLPTAATPIMTAPPNVRMMPNPQQAPVTIVAPPQAPAVTGPGFQPAPIPTFTPALAAPKVDILPGLTPARKPSQEPMPTVPVPPRELRDPPSELNRQDSIPAVAQAPAQPVSSAPMKLEWTSARQQLRSEPRVASQPAKQAPTRQTPAKAAPTMPPMPDFGPSPMQSTRTPVTHPSETVETRWTEAKLKTSASPPRSEPVPSPPSLASQPARGPVPEPTRSPVQPLAATPASQTIQAVWQQSPDVPQPVRVVRAEGPPKFSSLSLNLEQQIRSAAGFAVTILEIRHSTPGEMVISFTADREADARAAAEAISKLAVLKPFKVSFNARITGK